MTLVHGQELSNEFLDEMWDAIINKIPANKLVQITKNYDQAVAAIKHFIDLKCYNENFDLSFSSDFKCFRKSQFIKTPDRYERFTHLKKIKTKWKQK